MSAAPLVGPRIAHGFLDDSAQISTPARRSRQGGKMDDANERLAMGIESHASFSPIGKNLQAGYLPGATGGCSRTLFNAASAASLSAAFLLLPRPRASSFPWWCTVHSNTRS